MPPDHRTLSAVSPVQAVPEWLPKPVVSYLAHTCLGVPIRSLARTGDCHPSTILRRVQKVETLRDDPLIDRALDSLQASHFDFGRVNEYEETRSMPPGKNAQKDKQTLLVEREAKRILRRLCEKDAFLLVAPGMERAAVFRDTVSGKPNRIAVLDREVAYAFALKEWIEGNQRESFRRYTITGVGRAALKRLLAEDRKLRDEMPGFAENQSPFQSQHREYAERYVMASDGSGQTRIRYNLAESPLTSLSRRRSRTGEPFLGSDLVEAGERLREDFEVSQIGPRVAQNWERFLTADVSGGDASGGPGDGSSAARERVAGALKALGPDLADIAFRCCCFLEGLEAAERRMGWSARSGKIVLRIALQRLAVHYGLSPSQPQRIAV